MTILLSSLIADLQLLATQSHKDSQVYVSYPVGPDICDHDTSSTLDVTMDSNRDVKINCCID